MVRPRGLVHQVSEALRQQILTGQFPPGSYLPARRELAAEYGVGLSTVHEAIQALTAVGLLQSRPGKGTWVQEDALDTLIHPQAIRTRLGKLRARDVCEARAAIEVALTGLAAQRATDEDIAQIMAAHQAVETSLKDPDRFMAADRAFHLAVARSAHNDLLEQFYHLAQKLFAAVSAALIQFPAVKEESVPLQRAVAESIAGRDPARARAAAEAHMAYIGWLLAGIEAAAEQRPFVR